MVDRVREQMGPTRVFWDTAPEYISRRVARTGLRQAAPIRAFKVPGTRPSRNISCNPRIARRDATCYGFTLQVATRRMWASAMNVNSVGPDDDFFILGGDSLSGARLLTSVQGCSASHLSLQLLLQDAHRCRWRERSRRHVSPTLTSTWITWQRTAHRSAQRLREARTLRPYARAEGRSQPCVYADLGSQIRSCESARELEDRSRGYRRGVIPLRPEMGRGLRAVPASGDLRKPLSPHYDRLIQSWWNACDRKRARAERT